MSSGYDYFMHGAYIIFTAPHEKIPKCLEIAFDVSKRESLAGAERVDRGAKESQEGAGGFGRGPLWDSTGAGQVPDVTGEKPR